MPDPEQAKRPTLPASSSDFALPHSSSSNGPSADDINILHQRFRRPSLLAPKATYFSETRLHSPLAISAFSPFPRRKYGGGATSGGSTTGEESDREGMWTDSPPSSSSENRTPPTMEVEQNAAASKNSIPILAPSTPPPKVDSCTADTGAQPEKMPPNMRRLSIPLKTPRLIKLLAESRPEEDEVRSEAAFQRLVSELPSQPRTPRNTTDRGRYPEEATNSLEEPLTGDSPSDDDDDDDTFAYSVATGGSEPITILGGGIMRTVTPAQSINGDDMYISESPITTAMDIDSISASPSFSSISSWRYTPPPTSSAVVRSNKRKLEDRFDPYPSAKRRAVSPSIAHHLRDSLPHSPRSSHPIRIAVPIPINVPGSAHSSTASSPTISTQYLPHSKPLPMTSSPTLRASMGLASPILRPVGRMRWGGENEREVDGAGEGVGSLTLG